MELIPVFAFIVLVASIATFIFSLAAYVLYKIRERKGRYATKSFPKAFQAELVSPNYFYLPDNGEMERVKYNTSHINNEKKEDAINELNSIEKNNGNELVWR